MPDFVANLCAKTSEIEAEENGENFLTGFSSLQSLDLCVGRPSECCWRGKVAKLEKPSRHFYFRSECPGARGCRHLRASDSPMMPPTDDDVRTKMVTVFHFFLLTFSRLVTKFSPSTISLHLLFDLCSLSDRIPAILIAPEALPRALFTDEFSLHKNFHFFTNSLVFTQIFSVGCRLLQSVLANRTTNRSRYDYRRCWLLN